ncbi:uncharacterized protein LOC111707474 [Eurytemora carolleeae]|uniref:uncharacterized protein LOC111707474 n=1 Tax=Eurytemora carolleeae TaxID=1294199 RepID=UPI000C790681|nr:uncharacterized protein LOC111707474 [Eurytemora carolleeae]|eukprot:XP_023336353.1 uncharacterized protein LOC111707474 [Eurytemora affinis]
MSTTEVDPRVEWCMKIMDQEGMDMESEVMYLSAPVTLGATPAATIAISNFVYRLPIKTNMGAAILATPIAFGCGLLVKRWRENINRENMATMKHYILTHPERFPEPKRTKYIDLIEPWNAGRL